MSRRLNRHAQQNQVPLLLAERMLEKARYTFRKEVSWWKENRTLEEILLFCLNSSFCIITGLRINELIECARAAPWWKSGVVLNECCPALKSYDREYPQVCPGAPSLSWLRSIHDRPPYEALTKRTSFLFLFCVVSECASFYFSALLNCLNCSPPSVYPVNCAV